MEYRGVEFTVLQTANPKGWRWTVEMAGRKPKSGVVRDRAGAIINAKRAIDLVLGAQQTDASTEQSA
jgi:hypothetical protein